MPRTIPSNDLRMPRDIVLQHKHWPAFRDFHKKNPQVLEMILAEIDKAIAAGLTQVSIKTIIGHIRWNLTISTVSQDGYKINDAYTSLYAVMISKNWPEYSHLFEQREKRAFR